MRGRGAGFAVAAAFVGPGTVTTATLAGARYGSSLLVVVVVAIALTFALQALAARTWFRTGAPFGRALRQAYGPVPAVLVWLAVALGALAFQSGNLAGTALGLETIGMDRSPYLVVAIADAAFLLIWFGRVRTVLRVLTATVALMGASFVLAAVGVVVSTGWPDGGGLSGSGGLALALVGTTVVPYNLFLHGALLRESRSGRSDEGAARRELAASVAVGGLVTAAILVAAAGALPGADVADGPTMARGLDALAGSVSRILFGVGIAAAGFSSAITAPLAAAFTGSQVLRRDDHLQSPFVRGVATLVIVAGAAVAASASRPVPLIVAAQAVNGLLVPILAVAVVHLAGRRAGPAAGRG